VFGKDRKKGIRLRGLDPEIVDLGNGVAEDDLLFHDEKAPEPSLAYLLSRMHYPDFPEPMGVFRAVEKDTYNDLLVGQIDAAAKKKPLTLEGLFAEGDTWEVS